jgi:hypothetical protein
MTATGWALAIAVVAAFFGVMVAIVVVGKLTGGARRGVPPARPEWRPDAPAQFTGAPPYPPSTPWYPSPAVVALLAQGNKLGAIKQYRLETGAGLAEAKKAVEGFQRGMR